MIGAAITSREQLLQMLAEAAELEHNLLCNYLFATFSLKQGAEEGLRPADSRRSTAGAMN